jgi:CheY-like chemotaxis protein
MRTLVHSIKCRVVILPDGHDMVKFVEEHHDLLSVIIMEVDLPYLSGLDAARLIRYHES